MTSTRRPITDGMDRVVVGVQPNVVIPRQPRRGSPTGHRRHRRQRQHRGPVGVDPIGRPATQHPMLPGDSLARASRCNCVEIRRRGEAAAGQERAFPGSHETARPAPWPPGRGLADQHLRRQGAAESLALPGQLRLPLPPPADRALTVPDQHPRHRTQRLDQLPPARIQILGSAAGDQHRRQPSGNSPSPSSAPAAASPSGDDRNPPAA